ncbi:MAG: hypothetical protein AB7U61_05550 [Methylocystis sp.]
MCKTRNPVAGGDGARKSDCLEAVGPEKTKSAPQNQGKTLPSRATLARRFPKLRLNRYTGRWLDDASGARGDDIESLLAFHREGARHG